MFERRPETYLNTGSCLVCLSTESLTIEHIFPESLKKKYRCFAPIVNLPLNKADLCRDCHDVIDNGKIGKIRLLQDYGLIGLFASIALYKPSSDAALQQQQAYQWAKDSTAMVDALFESIDHLPDLVRPSRGQLQSIDRLCSFAIPQWESGSFMIHDQIEALLPRPLRDRYQHYRPAWLSTERSMSEAFSKFG